MTALLEYLNLLSMLILSLANQLHVKPNFCESEFSCQNQLYFSAKICNDKQLMHVRIRYLVDNTAKQLKHKCSFDLFLSVCETGVHFTL